MSLARRDRRLARWPIAHCATGVIIVTSRIARIVSEGSHLPMETHSFERICAVRHHLPIGEVACIVAGVDGLCKDEPGNGSPGECRNRKAEQQSSQEPAIRTIASQGQVFGAALSKGWINLQCDMHNSHLSTPF